MSRLAKALAGDNLTKTERADLVKALGYLGEEGDKNGVTISFGPLRGDEIGVLSGHNALTLDLAKLDRIYALAFGYDETTQAGATTIHEATHGRDEANGTFSFSARLDAQGNIDRKHSNLFWTRFYEAEERAYNNQSLVFKGLNKASKEFYWNPDWLAVDAERVRKIQVQQGAQRSVDAVQREVKQ